MEIAYIQVITSSHSPEHVSSLFVTCSVKAGIANILGSFSAIVCTNHNAYASGAFRGVNGSASGAANGAFGYNMDASRCSSIYGNSDTVTPLSLTNIFLIRY